MHGAHGVILNCLLCANAKSIQCQSNSNKVERLNIYKLKYILYPLFVKWPWDRILIDDLRHTTRVLTVGRQTVQTLACAIAHGDRRLLWLH